MLKNVIQIQNFQKIFLNLLLIATCLISMNANADKSDNCLAAQTHANFGQEAYGYMFDEAESFLRDNKIPHYLMLTGGGKHYFIKDTDYSKGYTSDYCPQVRGGCGADHFNISVSDRRNNNPPIVYITPLQGSLDTRLGYIILGKLEGRISYDSCDTGAIYTDGHIFKASISLGEIHGNIDVSGHVETTLSQVGRFIAKGYYFGLPSYSSDHVDKVLIIRVEDFSEGGMLQRFNNILEKIPGAGIIYK